MIIALTEIIRMAVKPEVILMGQFPIGQTFELGKSISTAGKRILNLVTL